MLVRRGLWGLAERWVKPVSGSCRGRRSVLLEAGYVPRTARYGTQSLLESPYIDVALPHCTLPQYIWEHHGSWADRVALECGVTGKSYTYGQARLMSQRLAASLLSMGVKPGDVVTLVMPNLPEFPISLLGAMEAGFTVSTINPMYTPDEMVNQMKDSEPACVITHPAVVENILLAKNKLKSDFRVVCTNNMDGKAVLLQPGVLPFEDLVQKDIDTSNVTSSNKRIDLEGTCLLLYSSGTTGLPKGVCLTHKSLTANLAQLHHPEITPHISTTKDHQDVLPGILPFFHMFGLSLVMLQGLRLGSKIVTLPKFETESFLDVLQSNKNIILYAVPPMVIFLGSHPAVREYHLEPIRAAISGGAPCSATDIERVKKRRKFSLIQAYGMTESSPVLTFPPLSCSEPTTIGPPISNTMAKVIDWNTGKALPVGETGELCFKGPQVMGCYHRQPEATAEIIDKDGWLHTGDIGYYDKRGYFFIVDRKKELIKVKGFQVPPAELEAVLREHPHIRDAGVVGIPCPLAGEKPVAFVVPKSGAPPVEVAELQKFVAGKVAPHKQISNIIVIDAIPKNISGKILRRELKEFARSKFKDDYWDNRKRQ